MTVYLLDKYEKDCIIDMMQKSKTMTEASKKLGVSLSTLKRYCVKNNLIQYYKINIELYDLDNESFKSICENSISMLEASKKMNIPFTSFIRRAKKLGCYITNQSGTGVKKPEKKHLDDIILGNVKIRPHNLKKKLFKLGYKKRICENCGCSEVWTGKPITLELHHINGDSSDNRLYNLMILCPNCHSQTYNYKSRIGMKDK